MVNEVQSVHLGFIFLSLSVGFYFAYLLIGAIQEATARMFE